MLYFGSNLAPLILVALSGNTLLGLCKESQNQRISREERDAYKYIESNSLWLRIFILSKKLCVLILAECVQGFLCVVFNSLSMGSG